MTVDLRLGDCLELMRDLPDASVDAVITDPPYGVRDDDWDAMNEYDFARFTMAWLSEAARVGKQLISFCPMQENPNIIKQLCEMLYRNVRLCIWDKPIGSQFTDKSGRGMWFTFEGILLCQTKAQREYAKPKNLTVANIIRDARISKGLSRGAVDQVVRGKKTGLCYRWEEAACLPTPEQVAILKPLLGLDGQLDAALECACSVRDETRQQMRDDLGQILDFAQGKRDVFSYRPPSRGIHPCEKPVDLMSDLIGLVTKESDTVLDPFMGSGTTGVACVKLNRNFIGMEINPDYFEIAQRRIAEAQMQLALI